MYFALVELKAILVDALRGAWHGADLRGRLGSWWHVVTHRHALDQPVDVVVIQGARDAR